MDLQYLNGFDGDGMEELGKVIKKNMAKKKAMPAKKTPIQKLQKKTKAARKSNPPSAGSSVPPVKKKKFFGKVLNKINKINPATVLLRNGILAAMKLNYKNVAGRLRWSYLSQDQAKAKGMDVSKYPKLVATRQKLEKIFFGAGGKEANLKKAILGGKGNKDKAVNGLGMLPMDDFEGYMSEYSPLNVLLGQDIYHSENIEGMDGFGELGEPVTLTSIAAAAGVIAGIVASLKQIGDVFSGKGKGSQDFDESKTDAPENDVSLPTTASQANSNSPSISPDDTPFVQINKGGNTATDDFNNSGNFQPGNSIVKASDYSDQGNENNSSLIPASDRSITTSTAAKDDNSSDGSNNTDKQNFWEKNKTWLKPVAIGAGGIGIIVLGIKLFKGHDHSNKSSPRSRSLSGVPHKRKKKKHHHRKHKPKHHHKSKHHHKKAVALL